MKPRLPQPTHYSYEMHRRQVLSQIIFPVVFAAVIVIGLIVLVNHSTFNQGGDVGRWAAISTMWIVIPLMIAGLLFLVILIGLIYLLARALGIFPYYTGLAQDYVFKARGYVIRGANLVVKPILVVEGFLDNFRAFF